MNNQFVEGRQMVQFDDSARVIKLDSHRFYKYVSGRGFKGVDFLCIQDDLLYLIELKDYFNRPKVSDEEIAQIFYQKCEDSLRLIEIIHAYLSRKWKVKTLRQFGLEHWVTKEELFWINAFKLFNDKKVVLIGNFEL